MGASSRSDESAAGRYLDQWIEVVKVHCDLVALMAQRAVTGAYWRKLLAQATVRFGETTGPPWFSTAALLRRDGTRRGYKHRRREVAHVHAG